MKNRVILTLVVSGLTLVSAASVAQQHPTSGEVRLRSTNVPDRTVQNVQAHGELRAAQTEEQQRASGLTIVAGLAGRGVSFQSTSDPTLFLRHQGFRVKFQRNDGSSLFRNDATFDVRPALSGAQNAFSYESVNFPGHYLRHCSWQMWIDNNARGNNACNADASVYRQDVSFTVEQNAPTRAAQSASTARVAAPVAGTFYRLRTQFRGTAECLEANGPASSNHNGAAFMDRCQNVTGQVFSFVPVRDNIYRIHARSFGQERCLEGNQASSDAHNGSAFMDVCRNVSGQQWKLVPHGDGFRLQNLFRGDSECLEGNQATSSVRGGNAFMDKCQNVSGQVWLLEAVR